jgi:hypothetical protein
MIHPDTELRFIGPEIGYGVFALAPIPRGTVVWVLCGLDMILSAAQIAAFGPQYRPILDRYAYIDNAGRHVLCWDAGRYVNHGCEPAMLGVGSEFEIAVRDITEGEEMTCEYATLNITEPMRCRCGSEKCREIVDSGDLSRLWPEFDRRVVAALADARSVAQPLMAFARDPDTFWSWVDGRASRPSHRDDRWEASRPAMPTLSECLPP